MLVQIDDAAFKSKPEKADIIKINQRILQKEYELSVGELADLVGNKGHTFLPAHLNQKRNANSFQFQKIFALDFDDGISLPEFMERANNYEIMPAFVYETFSCTPDKYKFRAVFVNDITITQREAAEIMLKLLRCIFPESDPACTDVSRMFFGGKKLVYLEPENQIDIYNVSIAAQTHMKQMDSSNYAKKIRRIADKMKIAINQNTLCIHRGVKQKMDDFEGNTSIIIENPCESSIFYVIEKTVVHPPCMQTPSDKTIPLVEGTDEKLLSQCCRLCKDFYSMEITHNQKFLIATNLLHLKNGKKIFFKAPLEKPDLWNTHWNYIKNQAYKPEHCSTELCPYFEECNGKTIIDKLTSKIQQIKKYDFGDVKDSENELKQYLYQAVFSNDKKIHLIKAQTAIGKTSTYCKLIKETPEKVFMIVLPTNKLQEEVANSLKSENVDVFVTPNIKSLTNEIGLRDLSEEIEELYEDGYGQRVKPRIKQYVKKEEIAEWQKERLDTYLHMKDQFDGSKCIVTTHALFLGLESSILQRYEIIVDEDILMTVFKNTASISFEELRKVLSDGKLDIQWCQRILELLNSKDGTVYRCSKIKLSPAEIDGLYEQNLNIQGSLIDFLQADSYHLDLQNEKVDFFCARELPDVKMTIVSATLVEKLYKRFCGFRSIEYEEVPIARYKGKLKQYTAHSLSRSNMEQIGLVRLNEGINAITKNPNIVRITFRKFSEGREHYYGNTEGLNVYKGKDLAVIGTPHSIPFIYKLIGVYLGFNTEDKLCQRYVEHNGYRFKFMTYGDSDMQMLQFYFIESTVEQTIGRARLLRFDCKVYLFSNFPIQQAEIIQEEYIVSEDSQ